VLFIHDWEWETARRHFVRAIELNPRYATARQWYSWYLTAMGHAEEAFAQGRLARDLDPASTSVQRSLGWLYYYASRTEEAIAQLRLTLSMNPSSEETQWVLGLALLQGGQLEEAEQLLRQAEQTVAGANHHAYASLADLAVQRGRRAEAVAAVAALHEVARERYVSPVDFARMYLALGETDRVFEWIERAWEERRGWLVYLKVEPSLAAVRSDQRYANLLHRMRLD